jgi:hypothetical protein
MAAEEYHTDPAPAPSLSHSVAMQLLDKNPFYAWYYHSRLGGNVIEPSKQMDNGVAAHLLLTGHGRQLGIIEENNYRKAAARIERDAIRARGLTPVLEGDYKIAEDMVRTARQMLGTMGTGQYAFDAKYGHCELVALNLDLAGAWVRCMIDFYGVAMPTGIECWDYKTTSGSANPVMLRWHMTRMGWALQAAMQERIIAQLKPELEGRIKFRFLVQETEPPFLCSVVAPAASAMIIAHKMIAAAIAIWKGCLDTDKWPAYPVTPVELAVQPWVEASWLVRELEFDEQGLIKADPWLSQFWPVEEPPPPKLSLDKLPDAQPTPVTDDEDVAAAPIETPQAPRKAAAAAPAATRKRGGRPRKPKPEEPPPPPPPPAPTYEPPPPKRLDL